MARVLTDNTGSEDLHGPQLRACVRGRSFRRRIYNPDRLKKPLIRRPGTKRGEGKWDEISWDQALDLIADKMKEVKEKYGNEAIYYQYASGQTGGNIVAAPFKRLLGLFGGWLGMYGTYSTSQITFAMPFTYGKRIECNSLLDSKHSKMLVLWGDNPVETRMSGGGNMWNMQKTRKDHPVRTIVIDPRYSETAVDCADEWIPIKPGSDAALASALAYEIIRNSWHDQEFLDRYCVGFDEAHLPDSAKGKNQSYRDYIMGQSADKTPKTPEWAAPITGIPASKIRQLAKEIATAKPCAIHIGWGFQRMANGENNVRAVQMIPIITGNVGIHGGGIASREGTISYPLVKLPNNNPVKTKISCFSWPDAITRGAEMTATQDGVQGKDKLDVPIKMMFNIAGNCIINQHSDTNGTVAMLQDDTKCELIVGTDNHMTASMMVCDLVLPATSNAEECDFIATEYSGDHAACIMVDQAIEPMWECRSHYAMCVELSKRLGLEEKFTEGRTQEQWRSWVIEQTRKKEPTLPTEEKMHQIGVHRIANPDDTFVAVKDFREDPEANPLATPSGKIEIYSERLAQMSKTWTFRNPRKGDVITPVPQYVSTWEGPEEAKENPTYPLQCIGHHYKGRTHSSYGSVDWLQEAHPQMVWINPVDAQARGIANGDQVEVFNDRGVIRTQARVTPRIIPGVVSVPQGAWYQPKDGVDVGGCVNTLTSYHPSPFSKGNPQHTNLVQVRPVG